MEIIFIGVAILALLILIFIIVLKPRSKNLPAVNQIPDTYRLLLQENVQFYRELNVDAKNKFEGRVQHFLERIRITGIRTSVEDIDRVLIGASAVIPIFAFDNWEYNNLNEVLLYPETFGADFELEGGDRTIEGMVGDGPVQHVMILSQHALRQGFLNVTDRNNTAIHEFVHLIDKTDGYADGVPEILLQHPYTLPWLDMIHKNILAIRQNKSDIDPYGITSQVEFFAVVAEYFFERPDLFQNKHPELFAMLMKIFKQSDGSDASR